MPIGETYDLSSGRLAILRDFRPRAMLYLGLGSGALVVSVATTASLFAGLPPADAPILVVLSIVLGLWAVVWLFAGWNLRRASPSKLSITADGLRFEFPSGRATTISWRGRPRPFETEPVVCDIWVRSPPTTPMDPSQPTATIALCPPYPRKTRFYPSVGLSREALEGILGAASVRGLRVAQEQMERPRVPGFDTPCYGAIAHYTVFPKPSAPP